MALRGKHTLSSRQLAFLKSLIVIFCRDSDEAHNYSRVKRGICAQTVVYFDHFNLPRLLEIGKNLSKWLKSVKAETELCEGLTT